MSAALGTLRAIVASPPPWWSPYLTVARRLLSSPHSSVAAALNAARDDATTPTFIEHTQVPNEAYEAFIARTSRVPTRDNVHDLFNGLIWLAYPQTKRRLNAMQAQQIAAHGIGASRGALRDALTLFDENAGVLQAPTVLIDALLRRDWPALFVTHRAEWASARLVLFGHALLEKLVQPRKGVTAHVWVVADVSDTALANSLDIERLRNKHFLPLPVLGVPGWWSANEDPTFYDDTDVFRPASSSEPRPSQ